MKSPIIIGTRGSDLALWQANFVQSELKRLGHASEIHIIKTQGDQIQHLPFDKMEGKGFFTKEIEAALLDKSVDIAVHSHKDLETTNPDGLVIAAVSERENPRDFLLINKDAYNPTGNIWLKDGAVVGTSAARRISQLQRYINPEQITMLRGNVPTRIQKLRDKKYDAILVAAAGVTRLQVDLSDFIVKELEPDLFVPAPAQGILGIQCRESDTELREVLKALHVSATQEIIDIERGVLRSLQGGCQVPLGVYAEKRENKFCVWVAYAPTQKESAAHTYFESDTAENALNEAITWVNSDEKKKD